jgi:hypothetical protein
VKKYRCRGVFSGDKGIVIPVYSNKGGSMSRPKMVHPGDGHKAMPPMNLKKPFTIKEKGKDNKAYKVKEKK